ncbi:MAG TPA: ribosome-associated translation inhibitor RaiA [Terriglobales bacterium]|nr:ribosome-associated translation inhibitor RaiA [Terriglobales bacterium]
MNVEYTGRQYEITPAIRKEVEARLTKIRKILGNRFETKVILVVEKHRHKAEITIKPRNGPLVGVAQAGDMNAAIHEAFTHLENQAVKYKSRWRTRKRRHQPTPISFKWDGRGGQEGIAAAQPEEKQPVLDLVAHRFPAVSPSTAVHLVRSTDAVALRPMTLEEAIKEAHFRDRDVFVFRDPSGKVMVLHRTRDGRMELIEAP